MDHDPVSMVRVGDFMDGHIMDVASIGNTAFHPAGRIPTLPDGLEYDATEGADNHPGG